MVADGAALGPTVVGLVVIGAIVVGLSVVGVLVGSTVGVKVELGASDGDSVSVGAPVVGLDVNGVAEGVPVGAPVGTPVGTPVGATVLGVLVKGFDVVGVCVGSAVGLSDHESVTSTPPNTTREKFCSVPWLSCEPRTQTRTYSPPVALSAQRGHTVERSTTSTLLRESRASDSLRAFPYTV